MTRARPSQPSILIAESGTGFGGTGKYLSELVGLLDRRRYDVRVAAVEEGPFIAQVRAAGIPVSLHPSWRFPWGRRQQAGTSRWLAPATEPIRRMLRYLQYGVVATAQLLVMVPVVAAWLLWHRIRLVHLNNEVLSHLPLLIAAHCLKCRVVCHLHGWRELTASERWVARWVDVFVCVTELGARFHSDQLGGREVLAIPNGLLLNERMQNLEEKRAKQRAAFGLEPQDFAVAILGRLVPWKGHDVYLRALAKVTAEHPEVVGLIVGCQPHEVGGYYARLVALAREFGITSRVRFLPWQEDVWSVYAAADLVVHASTEPEPFGFVILEAMAAEKPVIAVRSGGVTELVVDDRTGLLVQPGDVDGMADAIRRLCSDGALAQCLSRESHAVVTTTFTMERNAAQVSAVYDELLGTDPVSEPQG